MTLNTPIQGIRTIEAGDERGLTLIELLVTMVMSVVIMSAVFTLLVGATRVGYGDTERSASLSNQTVAFSRMINEIRQGYQVNCPSAGCANNASSNYIDFDERIVESGAQVDRRVSYVCNVAQPGVAGQYECVRYEAPASDATDGVPLSATSCSQCLSAHGGSAGIVYIQHVVNSTVLSGLTTATSPTGAVRWVAGKATIYTPGTGTLSTKLSPYAHDFVLQQSFYMQQLGFGQ